MWPFSSKFDPRGKHCYVSGGSSGLGRALAKILVERGAHVTIVARGLKQLEETEEELKAIASPSQRIHFITADLTSAEESERAVREAARAHEGRCPDMFFLCAGSSFPELFIDVTADKLKRGFDLGFWVQAYTAHAAARLMVAQRLKGKIVFVSSFLGFTSFAGYSTYSPAKYALRGLADTLRSEMKLYGIDIHIFMPAGIDSPGYVVENSTKHAVTKKLEEGDKVISPRECAMHLVRGLEKGYYQPCTYFITDLVRTQSRGMAPSNNVLLDTVYWFIAGPGLPMWRCWADWTVKQFAKPVQEDLEKRGFYTTPSQEPGIADPVLADVDS